jgi:hypothetical protein
VKLKREDIQPIVEKIINKIPVWQGGLMSRAARLALLKFYLAIIPIYLMSVIKFPKRAIDAINSQMGNFFWNDQENKHNYHLANWKSMAQMEFGGIGAPDLKDMNMCLLASWIQRYQDSNKKLWRAIIDAKYQTCTPNIVCCNDRQASPFRKGVMWAAEAAKMGYMWKICDGC